MMQQSLFTRDFYDTLDADPAADEDGLRYYQVEARESAYRKWFEDGDRSTLIVKATGTGKTQTFVSIGKQWPQRLKQYDSPLSRRVLILAHRTELVEQAAERWVQMTGYHPHIDQADLKADLRADVVVASIDTIKLKKRLERYPRDHFGLIIVDECFPAGTLVDGRPIETLRPGDEVSCVNHATGQLEHRRVVTVFEREASELLRVEVGGTTVDCTPNHPFFVKGVGYVQAKDLVPGDVLCLREDLRAQHRAESAGAQDLLEAVQVRDLLCEDGGDQPDSRVLPYGAAEPDARPRHASQGGAHAAGDWPPSAGAGRERQGSYSCGARPPRNAGSPLGAPPCGADQGEARVGLPEPLQAGPGSTRGADSYRGGRTEPRGDRASGAGRQEGGVLAWARVDRVARIERGSAEPVRVYNLEVEGCHTYFANGVLVHNCHHYVAKTFKRPFEYFKEAKILGVTATPDRSDAQALGKVFDDVAYVFDIVRAVEAGYLVKVRGKRVFLDTIKLDGIKTTAGDFAVGELDERILEAVEGIVHETLKLYPERSAVCFFPGVKSAELAANRFNVLDPDSAAFVSGATPKDERKRIMRDFRMGKIKRLCNCQVATEGFDAPNASLIVMGRPTKSRSLYAQMAGRGTRPHPGCINGLEGEGNSKWRRAAIAQSVKPDMVILDFVGVSANNDLACPEDLLGGDYSDAEVEKAKELSDKDKKGGDTQAFLKQAREELRALAAAMKSERVVRVSAFDPFKVFGLEFGEEDRYARFSARASPRVLEVLKAKGVPETDLATLSKRAAKQLLNTMADRQKRGLCTYKQLRILQKHGVTDTDVPFARAGAALDYLARNGWGKAKSYSPTRLNAIVAGESGV